jgi:signal peptidase II
MQPYAKSVQNYLNLNKKIYPYFFAVIFASLDLITKYFIRVNNIQEQVIIDNFLTIDLTYNTGIAFGLFSEYTSITYVFSIFVFTWLIFQFKEVENGTVEFYSLTLILAGAIGNLGERGWNLIFNSNGKVTDFVELLFIPSFNLADTYISIGIVLLLYSEIKNK